jgi:hypothetical protein
MMVKRWLLLLLLVLLLASGCGGGTEWQRFEPEIGGFSILFPGTPEKQTETVPTAGGTIETVFFLVEQEDMGYSVNLADYSEVSLSEGDVELMLEGAREGAVRNVGGDLLEETSITLDGHPGRALKIAVEDQFVVDARFYLVGNRLYILQAISVGNTSHSSNVKKFLDSFRLE